MLEPSTATFHTPVLVVHGLWDNTRRIAPLVRGLQARGLTKVHAFNLVPASGSAPLEVLATQVAEQARCLHATTESPINVVGFSMGALVTRYYLQEMAEQGAVRHFVSIAGPHHGTLTAYAGFGVGIRQMRPSSDFVRSLGTDVGPLHTRVHCLYTPYDAMIVPARSAILQGAASVHRIPAPWHRALLYDRRVLDISADLLTEARGS